MTSHSESDDDPRARALLEIAAMDDELQRAFDRVLDAAEAILVLDENGPDDGASGISAAVDELFEAAAMRDIVGQRLTAVRRAVESLTDLSASEVQTKDDKSRKIEEKSEHESASDSKLLNGPQLPGEAKSQSEVDALFDNLD